MRRSIYDEDHEAFRSSVREFLDRQVKPQLEEHVANKQIPREFWIEAGKQGFLGLEIPEQYGGSEAGDYRFNAVLTEELAKVNMALPSCVGIHADICAPYLVHLTTDEQKQRWLPGFCSGEILTAIGMTEPSGGSDLAALKTTAVKDGDDYVINGSKTFITNGYSADLIIVAARTAPEKKARGITLFGVEATMEGFSRGRKLDKAGQDESDTAELFFEDMRVPAANIIGELDHGFIHMMTWLPQERLGCAVTNIQHAAQILEETHPVHEGPQGVRPVRRLVPAQQVPDGRAGHQGRGHPEPTSTRRFSRTPRASSTPSAPRRSSGTPPRCRTRSSTTASSCTAATAT